jgi:hypothetical protein
VQLSSRMALFGGKSDGEVGILVLQLPTTLPWVGLQNDM